MDGLMEGSHVRRDLGIEFLELIDRQDRKMDACMHACEGSGEDIGVRVNTAGAERDA